MATSFGAHAALEDLTALTDATVVADEEISTASTTVYGDFIDATGEGGNVAHVIQSAGASPATGGSIAYVNQIDGNNYAIVMQQGMSGLVYVNQTGGTPANKAFVVQIDTGTAARTLDIATAIGSKTAGDIAQAEFTAPTTLTTAGSVVVISQIADVELNSAVVYQNGTKLFAAVSQESGTTASDAYIVQVGAGMKSYIVQK
jgi:hypothetical protein